MGYCDEHDEVFGPHGACGGCDDRAALAKVERDLDRLDGPLPCEHTAECREANLASRRAQRALLVAQRDRLREAVGA